MKAERWPLIDRRGAGHAPRRGTTMATETSALEQARSAILRRVDAGIAEGPFSADWDSLTSGYRVPDWYVDGKFGIFIHWGPYSVPGYGSEWYPREMYRPGTAVYEHHRST